MSESKALAAPRVSYPATYRLAANDWEWTNLGDLCDQLQGLVNNISDFDKKTVLGWNLGLIRPEGIVGAFCCLAREPGSESVTPHLVAGTSIANSEQVRQESRIMYFAESDGRKLCAVASSYYHKVPWSRDMFVPGPWARDVYRAIQAGAIRCCIIGGKQYLIFTNGTGELHK